MKQKSLILGFLFTFAASYTICGQNLIGYKDSEIRGFMRANYKSMNSDKVSNSKFSYLKYTDNSDSQTILFFLSPDSVCRSVRIICDESSKGSWVDEFNSKYETGGKNKWIDRRSGKEYLIEIKDEKWSSTISIEPSK